VKCLFGPNLSTQKKKKVAEISKKKRKIRTSLTALQGVANLKKFSPFIRTV
jgi:hypothetical protein